MPQLIRRLVREGAILRGSDHQSHGDKCSHAADERSLRAQSGSCRVLCGAGTPGGGHHGTLTHMGPAVDVGGTRVVRWRFPQKQFGSGASKREPHHIPHERSRGISPLLLRSSCHIALETRTNVLRFTQVHLPTSELGRRNISFVLGRHCAGNNGVLGRTEDSAMPFFVSGMASVQLSCSRKATLSYFVLLQETAVPSRPVTPCCAVRRCDLPSQGAAYTPC